jgi:hypothetical protein
MGGNLFAHAMSEAEVQVHEVWLKVKVYRFPLFMTFEKKTIN